MEGKRRGPRLAGHAERDPVAVNRPEVKLRWRNIRCETRPPPPREGFLGSPGYCCLRMASTLKRPPPRDCRRTRPPETERLVKKWRRMCSRSSP